MRARARPVARAAGRVAEVLQDEARLPRDGDGGVVGAVGGFGDGEGAFAVAARRRRVAEIPQDEGEVAQPVATVGWSGP